MTKQEEIKVDNHQEWSGTYKGIHFKVAKWKRDFPTPELQKYDRGYIWNYYIYVKPRKNKYLKARKGFPRRIDYYKMYHDVNLHGGITYWTRKIGSSMQENDILGCDYGHIWDYEDGGDSRRLKEKTINDILPDIKKTIDELPKDLFFNK